MEWAVNNSCIRILVWIRKMKKDRRNSYIHLASRGFFIGQHVPAKKGLVKQSCKGLFQSRIFR